MPAAELFTAFRDTAALSSGCNSEPVGGRGLPGELLEEVFAGPLLQPLGTVSHQLPGDFRDEVRTLGIGHRQVSGGAEMAGISGLC